MKPKTIKFLKEHTAIICSILSFFAFQHLIRWVDPAAAPYDAGVLQIVITSIVMFTIFQWAAWQVIRALWPALGDYAKNFFNNDFKSLEKWQKVKIFLLVYFALFAALVMLSRVIN